MTFTIATMSRGDSPRLKEWVEYHVALGFDDFHIVLDAPCDDSQKVLERLDVPAKITVDVRPAVGDYYDGLNPAERWDKVKAWRIRHADAITEWSLPVNDALSMRQYMHLPAVLNKYALRKDGWLALIDVDEFLVFPGGVKVQDIVAASSSPRIRFLNFNFDTTGSDLTRPVLSQHVWRWAREDVEAYGKGWEYRVKTIARYDSLFPFQSVHSISPGPFDIADYEVSRLHHYKATDQGISELPYRIEDRAASRTV